MQAKQIETASTTDMFTTKLNYFPFEKKPNNLTFIPGGLFVCF